MIGENVTIQVFELGEGIFSPLGEINHYTSLIWPDSFKGYATFELCAPITEENNALLRKDRFVWCGGDTAAVIEIIQSDKTEAGDKVYKVKGRTLEMLLTTRIVWDTYTCHNKHASTAIYDLVEANCVNPRLPERKIPFLECATDQLLGPRVSFQKTGDEVYDSVNKLASEADLGFRVVFDPRRQKMIFEVLEGVDRSRMPLASTDPNPVVFSTDLEDLLSSSYYTNSQDVKTVALVLGEGLEEQRKSLSAGDPSSAGFSRRELFVDARDLQSQVTNESGESETLSDEEYTALLNSRGDEKLSECSVTESFEAQLRTSGGQYVFGVDYGLGDKVIMQDLDLGVQIVCKITEISESYSKAYELVLTFGYSYPTLIQRIKRQIS